MTIAVQCQCGKRLAAPPHLAGKRVRCPACGQPIAIPAPQGALAAAPQRAASPAPQRSAAAAPTQLPAAAQPIIVACRCGKQLRAQPHLAGKTVKCPACGQPLQIPSPRRSAGASLAAGIVPLEAAPAGPQWKDDEWDDLLKDPLATPAQAPDAHNPLAMGHANMAAQMVAQANAKVPHEAKEFGAFVMGQIFGGIAMVLGGGLWLVVGFLLGGIAIGGAIMLVLGVISLITGIATMFKR